VNLSTGPDIHVASFFKTVDEGGGVL